MMKLLKSLLLFLTLILLFSCKRDNEYDVNASVVGTWKPVKFKFTTKVGGVPVSETKDANACQLQSRAIYKEDLTGVESRFEENSGNCSKLYERNVTYNYNPTAKTLITSYEGVSRTVEVVSITNTTLIIKTEREIDGYVGDLEITNQKL